MDIQLTGDQGTRRQAGETPAPADSDRLGPARGGIAWNAAAQGLKAVFVAAYFVILARSVSVAEFGELSAVVAMAGILSPFSSLGTIDLMVKNVVVRNGSLPANVTLMLTIAMTSGTALTVVAALIPGWRPSGLQSAITLAVLSSELVFNRISEGAAYLFQSLREVRTAVFCTVLPSFARILGLCGALAGGEFSIGAFAAWYIGAALASCAACVAVLAARTGFGRPEWDRYRSEWKKGILFSIGLSSQTVYNDVDKVMLTRIDSAASNGAYSAAYRIVDIAFLPIRALLAATYPHFFRIGRSGDREMLAFVARVARVIVPYGLLAGVVAFVGAPLVPYVLGQEYRTVVTGLRILAVIPLLRSIHYLAANALTGLGWQASRTTMQITVAVANVGLNAVLIPLWSWKGAAFASVVSDALLAGLLWGVLVASRRRASSAIAGSDG